jgi:transcriptional regulator, GntR family
MIRHRLHVDFDPRRGLQEQVRETLINAILGGIFSADTPLPLLPPAGQPAAGIAQHHGAGV